MQKPTITLIVSTYNQPDFLHLVLRAINSQSDSDFECILADDGSTEETRDLIEEFSASKSRKFRHLWHEDHGFQKASILNKAATEANNEYLVFLDGDCIPRKHFIKEHRNLAKKLRIVGCSRILMDQTISHHLINNPDLNSQNWSFVEFLKLKVSGHINRLLPLLKLPLGVFRELSHHNWKKVRGCNFSMFKSDFIACGGFDESFTGWGYEDSDLVVRSIQNGCLVRRGDYRATVLHLWHQEALKTEADSNFKKLQQSIKTRRKTAIKSSITD